MNMNMDMNTKKKERICAVLLVAQVRWRGGVKLHYWFHLSTLYSPRNGKVRTATEKDAIA